MSENTSGSNGALDEAVAEVVDAFVQQVQQGHTPEVEEVARQHPHIADVLRQVLPVLPLLQPPSASHSSGAPASSPDEAATAGGQLGDFRILGELGRGGMGVVYLAEQISLRRPVALKVLPQAATLDSKQRQRFQNEAQAAASLHHSHIVPVYAIGCERGIHFYAMQLIEGLPLTAIISQQRLLQDRKQQSATAPKSSGTAEVALASTSPGEGSRPAEGSSLEVTTAYAPPSLARTPSALLGSKAEQVSSVVPLGVERDYYRWVAAVAVQAAEALDHAHQMGVVHRDIKPANLLLDGKGQVWVTDFGLAQVRQQDGGLTQTGDIVGTIRYMSPEQALAQRDMLDQRTDVYSLGATLYELLTLQEAFTSVDRQELLRQVISEDPARPRQLRRSIPVDLETIVLKAMEKRPQDRYTTAHEMAADLQRFLDDQPIGARRPSLAQRLVKLARRHQALVTVAGAALILVSLVSSLSAILILEAYQAEKKQRQLAQESQEAAHLEQIAAQRSAQAAEVQRGRAQDNLRKAVQAWGESFDYFLQRRGAEDTPELAAARKVQTEKAQSFLHRLQKDIGDDPERLPEAALLHFELGRIHSVRREYAVAERAFKQSIALYHQVQAGPQKNDSNARDLEAVYSSILRIAAGISVEAAGMSSNSARRQEMIDLYLQAIRVGELVPANWVPPAGDPAAGALLAEPNTYRNACKWLRSVGRRTEAVTVASRAISLAANLSARYAGSVWPPYVWQVQTEAYLYRGLSQLETGRRREAEEDFRQALALFGKFSPAELDTFPAAAPDLARVDQAYGELLWARGDRDQARDTFRRAEATWRRVKPPANARRHNELAWFLATCPDGAFRKAEEAVALSGQAVMLQPGSGLMWRTHGAALLRADRYQAAQEALEKGLLLSGGEDLAGLFFLALAHAKLGNKEQARSLYRQAVAKTARERAQDPELQRFRTEAAAVLGFKE